MSENYYYSAENNSFYPVSIKDSYDAVNNWPEDATPVSTIWYQRLMEGQMNGLQIVPNEYGQPTLKKTPAPTKSELIAEADTSKFELMQKATQSIAPLQDAVDLGIASESEDKSLVAWKTYRVLLNRVDTSLAPDIDWPKVPENVA